MGDFFMTEFWDLLPWMSVIQHWQLMKLLQSLQTDNKYWNQLPILRSTCFSSRKSIFSSPVERNYSHKQFLVVHLWMSCSLVPLCVLWVSNLLNSPGEIGWGSMINCDNHYWVVILAKSCHLLGQCHQGLWMTQGNLRGQLRMFHSFSLQSVLYRKIFTQKAVREKRVLPCTGITWNCLCHPSNGFSSRPNNFHSHLTFPASYSPWIYQRYVQILLYLVFPLCPRLSFKWHWLSLNGIGLLLVITSD